MATTPDGDGDTLAQLSARYASAAGESLEEAAAKERRAELEERAATWALLEVRGCRAAHAVPRCSDSCVSTNEGWLGEPAGCPEGDAAEVGLRLASALEALGRRGAAIAALARASVRDPSCARVRLARAKLLFRSGDKPGADAELAPLLDAARQGLCGAELVSASAVGVASDSAAGAAKNGVDSDPRPPLRLDPRTAGDAFYIAGWVRIHADDHTAAYCLWSEGATLLPADARLARQARKARTWGGWQRDALDCLAEVASELMRLAAAAPPFPTESQWTRTTLSDAAVAAEPALRLFAPETQRGCIAVQTLAPLLPPEECAEVCRAVEAHVAGALGGTWGTVRRSTVPTTDIAVEDVPALVPWLRTLLARRVCPWVAACFPRLSDGSGLDDAEGAPGGRLRVHDAFVVRYDAELGSCLLPEHSDTSAVSVTVALNQRGVDFDGGGLWIRAAGAALEPDAGCAVAFAGPLRHGGAPVTAGARMILVLFLYVDLFSYGHLLDHALTSRIIHRDGSVAKKQEGLQSEVLTSSASATGSDCCDASLANPSDLAHAASASALAPPLAFTFGEPARTSYSEGKLRQWHEGPAIANIGRALEGFVVYRETAQLMEALESSDADAADSP